MKFAIRLNEENAHTYSIDVDLYDEIVTSGERYGNRSTCSMLDLLRFDVSNGILGNEYASALTANIRLGNIRSMFFLREVFRKIAIATKSNEKQIEDRSEVQRVLSRKAPGFWIECVFFGKDLHHS